MSYDAERSNAILSRNHIMRFTAGLDRDGYRPVAFTLLRTRTTHPRNRAPLMSAVARGSPLISLTTHGTASCSARPRRRPRPGTTLHRAVCQAPRPRPPPCRCHRAPWRAPLPMALLPCQPLPRRCHRYRPRRPRRPLRHVEGSSRSLWEGLYRGRANCRWSRTKGRPVRLPAARRHLRCRPSDQIVIRIGTQSQASAVAMEATTPPPLEASVRAMAH